MAVTRHWFHGSRERPSADIGLGNRSSSGHGKTLSSALTRGDSFHLKVIARILRGPCRVGGGHNMLVVANSRNADYTGALASYAGVVNQLRTQSTPSTSHVLPSRTSWIVTTPVSTRTVTVADV